MALAVCLIAIPQVLKDRTDLNSLHLPTPKYRTPRSLLLYMYINY